VNLEHISLCSYEKSRLKIRPHFLSERMGVMDATAGTFILKYRISMKASARLTEASRRPRRTRPQQRREADFYLINRVSPDNR